MTDGLMTESATTESPMTSPQYIHVINVIYIKCLASGERCAMMNLA